MNQQMHKQIIAHRYTHTFTYSVLCILYMHKKRFGCRLRRIFPFTRQHRDAILAGHAEEAHVQPLLGPGISVFLALLLPRDHSSQKNYVLRIGIVVFVDVCSGECVYLGTRAVSARSHF